MPRDPPVTMATRPSRGSGGGLAVSALIPVAIARRDRDRDREIEGTVMGSDEQDQLGVQRCRSDGGTRHPRRLFKGVKEEGEERRRRRS